MKQARKITVPAVMACKGIKKITMLTAFDATFARLLDESGVDIVLVGDSLAMVALGHPHSLSVDMDVMIHHTRAVSRAVKHALVVGDMPFLSYQPSDELAVLNAGRFLAKGRAMAVKVEGGTRMLKRIKAITTADIPVMGHIGLTPQSVAKLGGFQAQAKTQEAAKTLVEEALKLEEAGCFSLVLEAVPAIAGQMVSSAVSIPVISIGAGPHCDGQVLVTHDILGLFDDFCPRFVKQYAELGKLARASIKEFCKDVQEGRFPAEEHTYTMAKEEA